MPIISDNASTTAYATNLVASTGPAILLGFTVHNSSSSDQYIQIHDAASLPANGVAPKVIFLIAAGKSDGLDWGPHGRSFANGIVFCNSSTGPTKTIGAADCWFDAQVTVMR